MFFYYESKLQFSKLNFIKINPKELLTMNQKRKEAKYSRHNQGKLYTVRHN